MHGIKDYFVSIGRVKEMNKGDYEICATILILWTVFVITHIENFKFLIITENS